MSGGVWNVRPLWRCRLFGHAMRRVVPSEYPAELRCARGCGATWHLPPWPPPPLQRGVIVGVAGESVAAGEFVTVTLGGQFVPARSAPSPMDDDDEREP